MKKLTDFEMLSILGGTANPEECKKLQEEVFDMEAIPIRPMKIGTNGQKNSMRNVLAQPSES
ncbi:MAG: hypothetical protein K1W02_12855 [Muribaculaceae bacterium]|jgi:hypothetical protein